MFMLIYADPALLNAHPKHNTNKYNSFLTFIKISTKRRFSLEILGKIFIPFDFKAHIFSTKAKHFLETSSYCNSVLQALYYCKPFRECVNNFPQQLPPPPNTPLPTIPGSPLAAGSASSYFASTPATGSAVPSAASPTFGPSKHITSNGTNPANKESTRTVLPSRGGPPPGYQINSNALVNADKDNSSIISVPGMDDTLFACLKDLFWKISTHKKKTGIVAPIQFINKVKKENGKVDMFT